MPNEDISVGAAVARAFIRRGTEAVHRNPVEPSFSLGRVVVKKVDKDGIVWVVPKERLDDRPYTVSPRDLYRK